MHRAYSLLDIKAASDDAWTIEGTASTPTPDRMSDVVEPMGAVYKLPMSLLWQHRHDQPVGQVEFAKPNKSGIPFRATITKASEFTSTTLRERALEAWESVKTGLVRAVSIGFSPLEYEYMESGGVRFKSWEWVELSLVTVPANAEATLTVVKSIDRELLAALGPARLPVPGSTPPGASGSTRPARVVHYSRSANNKTGWNY
jgi:uncharacterized protein